jgi:glycosyltransferase involved in cell wall biosynthesis
VRKNIAFFVISTELGGAEKSLLDYLKVFKDQHPSVSVVVPKSTGPLVDQINEYKIPVHVLPLPSFFLSLSRKNLLKSMLLALPAFFYSFIYLFKIHLLIRKKKLNIIHSTGLKYHLLLGITAFLNKGCHFHIHIRDIIKIFPIKFFLRLLSLQKNIHFIFNSKATAQSLPNITSLIIYNGFDDQLFSPGTSSLKQTLNINEDHLLVGIVGVIARWKGQREFLEMAKLVSKNNEQVHFVIVGDEIYDTFAEDGELDLLKKRASQYKLNSNVHFMGFQKNIENIYKGLDLLVHCSVEPEPFGRVLVEAMLCGCPVIASNKGGPIEIINSTLCGLLYEQGNISELSQKVSLALNDAPLRKQLSKQGRKRAEKFSIQAYSSSLSKQILQT